MTRTVSYPKDQWSRADAWHHLKEQMIPGCPKVWVTIRGVGDMLVDGWRKAHTETAWAWVYRGRS